MTQHSRSEAQHGYRRRTAGAVTAVAVERFALETGRWTYNELMPIVPLVNVGLWPLAQMVVLPALTLHLVRVMLKVR